MSIVNLPNIGGGSDPATINVSVLNGKVDPLATDYNGNIQNVNIAAGAGIVYSKLSLTDGIVNADINSSAAIVDTKLAQITTASKVAGSALDITGLTAVTALGADYVYISDTSDSGLPKKALASDLINTFTPSASNALSGSVIQVVRTQTGAVGTGSTVMPLDDTIPENTEGDEFFTRAITPNHASNVLHIRVLFNYFQGTNYPLVLALFQDSTVAALASTVSQVGADNKYGQGVLEYSMAAGTTSSTTFKVRAGSPTSTTTTMNGAGSSRQLGGVFFSGITITEIKA